LEQTLIQIYQCEKTGEIFASTESWHKCECEKKLIAETHEGHTLTWSNGQEWGEIEHPHLGKVMTYWQKGTPCYDTYTAPRVDGDGCLIVFRFDHDEGYWVDDYVINMGYYNGIDTASFGGY
jgi:hypothetical protein